MTGTKKKNKQDYSDEINEMYGFTGEMKVDFSRLVETDLYKFYLAVRLQKEVMKDPAQPTTITTPQPVTTQSTSGGLFGFGFIDGGLVRSLIGGTDRRQKIFERVLSGIDDDDLEKLRKKHPLLAKLGFNLLTEMSK